MHVIAIQDPSIRAQHAQRTMPRDAHERRSRDDNKALACGQPCGEHRGIQSVGEGKRRELRIDSKEGAGRQRRAPPLKSVTETIGGWTASQSCNNTAQRKPANVHPTSAMDEVEGRGGVTPSKPMHTHTHTQQRQNDEGGQ